MKRVGEGAGELVTSRGDSAVDLQAIDQNKINLILMCRRTCGGLEGWTQARGHGFPDFT